MTMKQKLWLLPAALWAAFVLFTLLLTCVDVQSIGTQGSAVGFATVNGWAFQLLGVHLLWYHITDWLGLVTVAFGFGFALLGLAQWIKRKSILKVDRSILILGAFYIVTLTAYLFFESYVINYRPVLIAGYLEASYPSSTTLLVLCVMPTAMMQLRDRIKQPMFRKCVSLVIRAFIAFMVIGRLISGVHWLTDIIGGILLSAGLVIPYDSLIGGKIHG